VVQREYLRLIINSFVQKDRRSRLLELLAVERRYDDFLESLLRDPRHIDQHCIIKLPSSQQSPDLIYQRLLAEGAKPPVYVVSSDYNEDGKEFVDIEAAVSQFTGNNSEALLFFPKVLIGYYEGHEGWRYVLKRNA
jgi:hypothetical protein